MNYKIVECVSVAQLEAEVNEFLLQGWKPAGGVACLAEGPYGEPSYLQAMFLE